ncbi:hypothetical protein [Rhodoblastus sp.]|mgnify:CR=1 FL=1|jgi:hypothetical protein|uniref:hypothetical protein n=1 Tax=Rhodoblastus sp. TaxID=1962975 RepID=UPI0025D2568B|nr:hypothetical protein [Rhodoblastus sp.]
MALTELGQAKENLRVERLRLTKALGAAEKWNEKVGRIFAAREVAERRFNELKAQARQGHEALREQGVAA